MKVKEALRLIGGWCGHGNEDVSYLGIWIEEGDEGVYAICDTCRHSIDFNPRLWKITEFTPEIAVGISLYFEPQIDIGYERRHNVYLWLAEYYKGEAWEKEL